MRKEVFLIGKQVKGWKYIKRAMLGHYSLVIICGCFLGVGIITGDFTSMPLNVAITITVIVALLMNRKESFAKKLRFSRKVQAIQTLFLMMLILF